MLLFISMFIFQPFDLTVTVPGMKTETQIIKIFVYPGEFVSLCHNTQYLSFVNLGDIATTAL